MLKRLLISLLFLIPIIGYSQTYTYEQMQDYVNTNITTNGANLITGAKLNTALNYITKETGGLKEYDTTATYIQYKNAVLHDSGIYICNTTIGVAENWTASKWTPAGIVNEINGDTIFSNFYQDTTLFSLNPTRLDTANTIDFVLVEDTDTLRKAQVEDLDSISTPLDSLTYLTTDTLTARQIFYVGDTSGTEYVQIDTVKAVFNGAMYYNVRSVGTPYDTLLVTDYYIDVKYTLTGAVEIYLPDAQKLSGRTFFVKDVQLNAGTNNITIKPQSGTIDGEATAIINGDGNGYRIWSDGSVWLVFAYN